MRKKCMAAIMAAVLTAGTLAGCGNAEKQGGTSQTETKSAVSAEKAMENLPDTVLDGVINATPEMYPNTDLSNPCTVNMYLIGDTPNDWDEILKKINEELEPFNTTLKTTIMSWSDYATMYSLVLAGGEQVDLIYTSPWCSMYTEAAKGSFYELTDEFREKYMPLSMKYQAPESWSETTLAGKTIAVPSNEANPQGKLVAVRKDLMDKYGIDDLENWEDYKKYLLTIAEKETPESGIYALAAAGHNNELWDVYRQQTDTMLALDSNFMDFIYEYPGEGEIPDAEDIKFVYEYEPFRAFAKDMKALADAGCWSRSALTNTVTAADSFGALQSASIAWNGAVFTYMKQAEKTDGVECMAYDLTKDHLVCPEAYSNNDMAIAAGSQNPERAAMVLDLLKYDTSIYRLLRLGEEGVHYSIDGYQYIKLEKTADYPPDTLCASWAVKNGDLEQADLPERQKKITDDWKTRVVSVPTITFVFDDSNVKSYVNAVGSVLEDYIPMLELGMVDDVDQSLDECLQKCYDAGLQEIYDEFYAQYNAWKETR